MFMLIYIKEALCRRGTLRVRIAFGEFQTDARESVKEHHTLNQRRLLYRSLFSVQQQNALSLVIRNSSLRIDIQVYLDSSTVQAVYEGLLVTPWTTAQTRLQQRRSRLAQLALILVFFATLTVVGRCYASSKDVVAPLDKFHPRVPNNSIYPISNLVLGRLRIPNLSVKSDTRVIREENHPEVLFNRSLRIKREYEKPTQNNRIIAFRGHNEILSAQKNLQNNDGSRLLSSVENISASIGAGNSSTRVTVNETALEDPHQNDSHFPEESQPGTGAFRTTQRPMPPAHAHDNESGQLILN